MSEKPYVLEPGDKVTPVALYLANTLLIGELVTKAMVRVSAWLRTPSLPDFAGLYGVTMIRYGGGEPEVRKLSEMYVPVAQVIAMHLAPPATDKPEFDPSEMNRKFEPVSVTAGPFRFDGAVRLPQHLTLGKQMVLLREAFTTIYDVTISPTVEGLGDMKSTMVVLRPGSFLFSPRSGG